MKRSKILIITAVYAALVAGCGQQQQGSTADEQPETVIVYRDSTEQQDGSSGNSSGNSQKETTAASQGGTSTSTQLPDDFPLPVPDGYEVQIVRDDGDDLDVDLQVPDGQRAYDEYLQTLQDEGFTVEESGTGTDDGQFDGDIDFRNAEFDGDMDFSGTLLAIDLDRLDSSANDSSDDACETSSTTSTELPNDFPVTLPGDAQVQSVREGGDDPDDARDIDVDLNISDGQVAYD